MYTQKKQRNVNNTRKNENKTKYNTKGPTKTNRKYFFFKKIKKQIKKPSKIKHAIKNNMPIFLRTKQ